MVKEMMMYTYKVQKVSQNDVARATSILADRGAEGWRVLYITPYSQDLIVVLEKETANKPAKEEPPKRGPGRPKKSE